MSKPSAKKLAKRNARAKQVKKALNIQTEAARRATQADIKNKIERKLNRRYNNTDDLVSGMINDSMEIFNKIETIRQICKGRLEQIQILKNTEPTKYGALDSAEFDRMLEKITPMQELAKKMLVTAGKLEDMRKSEASAGEQMSAFVADMQNLSDLQVMYMDLMNTFSEVNDKFNDDIKHPKEADKTLGDISDDLLDDSSTATDAREAEVVTEENPQQEVTPSEPLQPKAEHQWPDVVEFDSVNVIEIADQPVADVDLSSIEVPEEVKQNPYLTLFRLVQAGNTSVCRNVIWSKEDNSLIEIPSTVVIRVKQETHPEQFFGSDIAK